MKSGIGISLMIAGAALGLGVGEVLHAQATPPIYSVSEQGEVTDAAKMKPIVDELVASIKAAGAKPLARGGKVTVVEGKNPGRVVINQWPGMDAATKFYNSERTKKLFAERKAYLKGQSGTYLVEGLSN
jgi:uncharacterized protein (DUF1330 family)